MNTPFTQSMHAGWTVRAVGDVSQVPAHIRGRAVPATVPGCIHTDLMDAGLIPDAAIGENEGEVQWVSWTDWRYETTFEADPRLFEHHEIDLVFECLDTVATVELNGDKVGEAASEFMPHRFSVLGLLKPGANRLAVTFTSPLRYVHEQAARLGARPVNGDWDPFVFIRKCASNFQWDWGPKVATCGITAPVGLHAWSLGRIASVRPLQPEFPGLADLVVYVDVVRARHIDDLSIRATLRHDSGPITGVAAVHHGAGETLVALDFPRPRRWYPHGLGVQPRYALEVQLCRGPSAASGYAETSLAPIEERSCALGFRMARWRGLSSFDMTDPVLRVNDIADVFCKGANWIPEGLWPRDRTPERVRKRLQQLVDANMNMVRVWGGGRYEPDWFYDLCDEMGIMVWQDFMFSCGMYPEEDPYPALIETEARYQVARLSRHPSVVLWCGGNECTWAHESWDGGWKKKLKPGQTWGRGYWLDMLSRIVAELDSTRPYWPNSPWSGDETKPNDTEHGDRHTWDVWGDGYRKIVPMFCSEFGQQAPSNIGTLREAGLVEGGGEPSIVPARLAVRQRGPGGNKRWYDDPIAELFRPPRDFDEWHYLGQLLQARSLRTGIEWMRINRGRCSGALVWQLNDAWPGLSWSLIDSAGREKPAYHAVKEAFRPRALIIQPLNGSGTPHLFAVNDTQEPASYVLTIRRMRLDGEVLGQASAQRLAAEPQQVSEPMDLEGLVGRPADRASEFLVADAPGHRATWFYLPDKDLRYPPVRLEAREFTGPGNRGVKALATTVMRDVLFRADLLPLEKDDTLQIPTLRTFLPGEEIVFEVENPREVSIAPPRASDLFARPMLWCANWFGAGT